jgi:glycosyltransferase involved in cell wall biosynthesis
LLLVSDKVVVDVDHSARFDLHTGIQQVVRQTLPLWVRDHGVVPVAWTDRLQFIRTLSPSERRRALHWGLDALGDAQLLTTPVVVAPWRTVVVLPETPARDACDRLAALAQYSGNSVVAIGYDCIPVISADLVPASEPGRFARYLTIIKYARRVAGISSSATSEFRGFSDALPAQGLEGPQVVECTLPADSAGLVETNEADAPGDADALPPLVLCVGSLEPRKNQLGLLYAAECLWREGLDFRLLLIGGSGWGDQVPRMVAQLRGQGRQIEVKSRVTDAELRKAYRRARFTTFASLHEGYGLPVAESLSLGTPVITSDFGSTREIGEVGGAILIDPADDQALVDAMRTLLTDDDRLRSLQQEIAARPVRTWEHYAAELWDCLVRPELPVGPEVVRP